MADNPMEEIKRLRTKVAKLEVALRKCEETNGEILKAFLNSAKVLEDKDRLAAKVEELRKNKEEAEPLLKEFPKIIAERNQATAKLSKFSTDTQELIGKLECADLAFRKPGSSDLEKSHNLRQGVDMALVAVLDFLRDCGVRQRFCWPLMNLRFALKDAENGVRNPVTAAVNFNRGQPTGTEKSNQKVIASWLVTGLHRLGETKTKAYDIVAEESGLPRKRIMKFRQKLTSPKKKAPMGAQKIYDSYESKSGDSPEHLQEYVENMLNILCRMRGN